MRTSFLVTSALALSCAASAQIWTEEGDAGMLPETAQFTIGFGALTQIDGNLAPTDVDLYTIMVVNIAKFSATMTGTGFEYVQLMLFKMDGTGVTLYSTVPGGKSNEAVITGQFVDAKGQYLLGISYWNNDARSTIGEIWTSDPFYEERQPDGFGSAGPLFQWELNDSPDFDYSIVLTGTEYSGVPEPGTMVCLAAGLVAMVARRKR
ncbi:MAG: PEP-CTERM sorting domain-containing protein [Armatimonadetes bacterium]|nr:PEP-CTERM sorting domain-containing protein [Armatimonadota bacterium]